MPRNTLSWAIVLVMLAAGCKKPASKAVGGPGSGTRAGGGGSAELTGDAEMNNWLAEVLQGHGISARVESNWVSIEGTPVRVNGQVTSVNESRTSFATVQLAMRLMLADGRVVGQPVVGWGKDRSEAVADAEASFLLGTFHAWLGAFIDPAEEHAGREERVLAGRKRLVTLGDVVMKSFGEAQPKDDRKWRERLMGAIDRSGLTGGAHWIDVYNGLIEGKQELEIQLDGVRWTEMEERMRAAPWPNNGTFTSVRLFLVLQDPDDPTRPATRPVRAARRASTRVTERDPK
jgi:hypothetical protein